MKKFFPSFLILLSPFGANSQSIVVSYGLGSVRTRDIIISYQGPKYGTYITWAHANNFSVPQAVPQSVSLNKHQEPKENNLTNTNGIKLGVSRLITNENREFQCTLMAGMGNYRIKEYGKFVYYSPLILKTETSYELISDKKVFVLEALLQVRLYKRQWFSFGITTGLNTIPSCLGYFNLGVNLK